MVYVASLNDQVVPIYSGIFTAATHPLILRALYIDGDAYQYVIGVSTHKPIANARYLLFCPALLISSQTSWFCCSSFETLEYRMVASWPIYQKPRLVLLAVSGTQPPMKNSPHTRAYPSPWPTIDRTCILICHLALLFATYS